MIAHILFHMETTDNMRDTRCFTRAFPPLWSCDLIVSTLTRDPKWPLALLRQLSRQAPDVTAAIAGGKGWLLRLAGRAAMRAKQISIDPDGRILERARSKPYGAPARFRH